MQPIILHIGYIKVMIKLRIRYLKSYWKLYFLNITKKNKKENFIVTYIK